MFTHSSVNPLSQAVLNFAGAGRSASKGHPIARYQHISCVKLPTASEIQYPIMRYDNIS